ncbi:hypothetical protein [Sphingomicrobium flavum]|uniref:hypothetical protein n=1 Tax=Sphingomicrobium flavum TaxID=1229164 RepID=UPI0021ADF5A5|nr:hypothetical protein [Sphingomicrobium flavum]
MTTTNKAPWHLWVIGLAALLFNAGGAFHYVMTKTRNADFIEQMPAGAIEYYEGFPIWMDMAWAIAIWFAVAGALLLLVRKAWAAPVFLIAFLAYLVSSFYTFALGAPPAEMMTTNNMLFSVGIGLQLLLLTLYSRAMAARGVLK